jgi:hypothetical protein
VDDEYDEGRGREHEHDEILECIRTDEVVAGAEHESREQEQPHADLNEATKPVTGTAASSSVC